MSINQLSSKRRYIPESVIADRLTQILAFCLPALVKIKDTHTSQHSQSSGFLLHIPKGYAGGQEEESFALIACQHSMERVNNLDAIKDYTITFQRSTAGIALNAAPAITAEQPAEALAATADLTVHLTSNMFSDVWSHYELDVVVLIVDYRTVTHWMHHFGVRFLEPDSITRGEPLIALQHPEGRQAEVSLGEIVEVFDDVAIEHNAKTDSGSSGAPMTNLKGCIIGMHQGRDNPCGERRDPYTCEKKHGTSINAILKAYFAQKRGETIKFGKIKINFVTTKQITSRQNLIQQRLPFISL